MTRTAPEGESCLALESGVVPPHSSLASYPTGSNQLSGFSLKHACSSLDRVLLDKGFNRRGFGFQ